MKKIILSVMMCAMGAFAFAQQGAFEIGGSISIDNSNPNKLMQSATNAQKNFSVKVLPSFMYNVSDKIAVGAGIGFLYNKDADDTKQSEFLIQPTVRYYVPITDKFSYAPQFFVGFGFGSISPDGDAKDIDIFDLSAGFNLVRFQYDFTSKIGLSFSCGNLQYTYNKLEQDDVKAENNTFNFGINLQPTLGFYYKF